MGHLHDHDGGQTGDRSLARNLAQVRHQIKAAAVRAGRKPEQVTLVAASKYATSAGVVALARAGHRIFGENRVQDAEAKARAAQAALGGGIEWHMIGHLQSNKVGRALEIFDVLETVDSVALAEAISNRGSGRNVPVLLEVNISGDPHKHGFTPAGLRAELPRLAGVAGLELLGLMTIPRETAAADDARPYFSALRELRDELDGMAVVPPLRHLSMGMSADFEVAIEEGATIVRVGAALFGIEQDARRGGTTAMPGERRSG